jgi:hypothetical protein
LSLTARRAGSGRLLSLFGSGLILIGLLPASAAPVLADSSTQTLPFSQPWTNTGLITTNDDWSGVPGIIGYRGDAMTAMAGVDPQTVLADGSGTPVDVNANVTSGTFATGGVAEVELPDPTIGLVGSGTARAPHIVISVATTGLSNINVAYNLRDIDGSTDSTNMQVALQFRVGSTGDYTNVPAGYVADASTGPSLATLVTHVSAGLPAAVDNQALVQVRILMTDAPSTDEMIGVDDISITASPTDQAPSVVSSTPANAAVDVPINTTPTVTFSEDVTVDGAGVTLTCNNQGMKPVTLSPSPSSVFTLSTGAFQNSDHCTLSILASAVTDTDANDPPDAMAADFSASFDTAAPPPTALVINEIDYDQPSTDTAEFLEIKNISGSPVDLDPYVVDYINGANLLAPASYRTTDLPPVVLASLDYFVVCANAANPTTCDLDVSPDTDLIQNGAPDAVALRFGGTTGQIVDTVSYEGNTGAPFTETAGAGTDTAAAGLAQGLSRCPDGSDTNNNGVDFILRNSTPGTINDCPGGDVAPFVASSNPASGALGVARNANVEITFSEPVDVTGTWYSISCASSGAHTAVASGGPTIFTLDPDADFASNESCTVTIVAANVTDQDGIPPATMAADATITFTTIDEAVCGDPGLTFVHDIQGSDLASPIVGGVVSIEGVVVGDYQQTGGFGGFYVQEEDTDADADPATSEGLFVFNSTAVDLGDHVRVKGTVTEFNNLTELGSVSGVLVCSTGNTMPSAAHLTLPVASLSDWEAVEGMRVSLDQTLTVTEVFNLGRFGEVSLSGTGRLPNPTNVVSPGAPAITLEGLNDRSRVILDDGDNRQNIDPTNYPQGGLSASNTLRVGDSLPGITAIGDQRFGNYRLQPVGPIAFDHTNPRTAAPEPVGGNLRVASFNVLNFFNGNGTHVDGAPGGFPTSRGAETLFEFDRQLAKEVAAITTLDADVIGLMELENDDPDVGQAAIEDLVDGLNAATAPGTYAFINTGIVGTDEIRVGLLYKPAAVTPLGPFAKIDTSVDPRFIDTKNRPSIAQTFELNATGARLTVVVNHLKSKGSDCNDIGDPDTGDGQGNCNITRTQAAEAIADWLATDPTGGGDADYLLIGDMNSYALEDPITAFKNDGFVDTISAHIGAGAYSYVFDGESGYLDHALASASLAGQVSDVTEWHINPDEPTVLDYNTNFKTANQINTFYAPDAYRSSDHDPVLVGLDLNAAPTVDAGGPYAVVEGGSVVVSATGSDPDGDPLTYDWDLDSDGTFETSGQTATFSAAGLQAPLSLTIRVRVSDGSLSATDTATVNVIDLNAAPTVDAGGPYVVVEGGSVVVSATGSDPDGDPLTYAWDLDDNGTFETPGQTATFSAALLQAPLSLTIRVRASDGSLSATDTATVNVIWAFSGFFQPVDNVPTLNLVNAGAGVPIKFSLNGDQGLAVIADGYPTSIQFACDASAPTDAIETTSSSGATGLTFDAATGTYTYVWKTHKGWAGTCRRFVLKLSDGTFHYADFEFIR